MNFNISIGLIGLSLLAANPPARAAEQSPTWYVSETSDVIVVGKLHVATNPAAVKDKFAEALAVTLDVAKVLKGNVKDSKIQVHYIAYNGIEKPLETQLGGLNGQSVILFLTNTSERSGYAIDMDDGIYRVIPASDQGAAAISELVAQEAKIDEESSKSLSAVTTNEEVVGAINALADPDPKTRDKGRNNLLKLGCSGVPSIIKNMRDYRVFHGTLVLPDHAMNGFEPVRQYNPATVYAALSLILNQITGYNFQHSAELKTQSQRSKDYHGWLVYLAHQAGEFGATPADCKAS